MRTSSFEHIVRLQFNSLMLIIIKNKCEIAETKQVERGTNDTCFYDCVSFKVLHFTIFVSDETLSTALHRLSEKQRSAILLRYFQDMNDREILKFYDGYISKLCLRPFYHSESGKMSVSIYFKMLECIVFMRIIEN